MTLARSNDAKAALNQDLDAFDDWFESLDQNDTFDERKRVRVRIPSSSTPVDDSDDSDDSDNERKKERKKMPARGVVRKMSGALERILREHPTTKPSSSPSSPSTAKTELQFLKDDYNEKARLALKSRKKTSREASKRKIREGRRAAIRGSLLKYLDETEEDPLNKEIKQKNKGEKGVVQVPVSKARRNRRASMEHTPKLSDLYSKENMEGERGRERRGSTGCLKPSISEASSTTSTTTSTKPSSGSSRSEKKESSKSLPVEATTTTKSRRTRSGESDSSKRSSSSGPLNRNGTSIRSEREESSNSSPAETTTTKSRRTPRSGESDSSKRSSSSGPLNRNGSGESGSSKRSSSTGPLNRNDSSSDSLRAETTRKSRRTRSGESGSSSKRSSSTGPLNGKVPEGRRRRRSVSPNKERLSPGAAAAGSISVSMHGGGGGRRSPRKEPLSGRRRVTIETTSLRNNDPLVRQSAHGPSRRRSDETPRKIDPLIRSAHGPSRRRSDETSPKNTIDPLCSRSVHGSRTPRAHHDLSMSEHAGKRVYQQRSKSDELRHSSHGGRSSPRRSNNEPSDAPIRTLRKGRKKSDS